MLCEEKMSLSQEKKMHKFLDHSRGKRAKRRRGLKLEGKKVGPRAEKSVPETTN